MILKLCRDVMNLEQLIQNNTVMGALTRVLQEEYKKSVDLSFNILRIFLAFSNFMEMHSLMANYKIGVLTMKVGAFFILFSLYVVLLAHILHFSVFIVFLLFFNTVLLVIFTVFFFYFALIYSSVFRLLILS